MTPNVAGRHGYLSAVEAYQAGVAGVGIGSLLSRAEDRARRDAALGEPGAGLVLRAVASASDDPMSRKKADPHHAMG